MIDLSQLRQHMTVVGSDSEPLGRIDLIEGGSLRLTRSDPAAAGTHPVIPAVWVAAIDGDQVSLDRTGEAARAAWRET